MTIQNDTELNKREATQLVEEALSINPDSSGVFPRIANPYSIYGYEVYITEPGLYIVREQED